MTAILDALDSEPELMSMNHEVEQAADVMPGRLRAARRQRGPA